jgi:K+-transporting ATPase KdpF subunit
VRFKTDDGCNFHPDDTCLLRPELGVCERLREAIAMENIISLAIAVAVGIYLLYALLRPERF